MKKIIGFGLSLMISGALMGCTTTSNNANLTGANTNTGYVTNNTNTVRTATPLTNSNTSNANSRGTANSRSNANTY